MADDAKTGYRKSIGYQAGLLGGFATLAAALLAFGDMSTRDAIAQRVQEDVRASLNQVIPKDMHDNNLVNDTISLKDNGRPVIFHVATQKGKFTAAAFNVNAKGYSGNISLIMGVKANGEILGVRVLAHSETPGLGDKIESDKSKWIYSFNGFSLDNIPDSQWAVKKDGGRFDQFSGATITPRAVVKAVKAGLVLFKSQEQNLISNTEKDTKNTTNITNTTSVNPHGK